jgi:hypothetical protein
MHDLVRKFLALIVSVTAVVGTLGGGVARAEPPKKELPPMCKFDKWFSNDPGRWRVTNIDVWVIQNSFPASAPVTRIPYDQNRLWKRVMSGAMTWSRLRNYCGMTGHGNPTQFKFDRVNRKGGRNAGDHTDDGLTIDFRNDPGAINRAKCNPGEGRVLIGCTYVTSSDVKIFNADVALKRDLNYWTGANAKPGPGQIDLWSLVAHELGHALGFGHPEENYAVSPENGLNYPAGLKQQVMASGLESQVVRRDLGLSDFKAMCTKASC